jgi:hypothetical protein
MDGSRARAARCAVFNMARRGESLRRSRTGDPIAGSVWRLIEDDVRRCVEGTIEAQASNQSLRSSAATRSSPASRAASQLAVSTPTMARRADQATCSHCPKGDARERGAAQDQRRKSIPPRCLSCVAKVEARVARASNRPLVPENCCNAQLTLFDEPMAYRRELGGGCNNSDERFW